MKILMITSKPFRPEPWIYREAKTLVNAGHNVRIIGWNRERKYKNKEEIDGIEIERIPIRSPYGSFLALLPLFPIFYITLLIKALSTDFDVIECHNFDTLPISVFIAKLRGKKVIYHSLDFYFTWFNRETSSKTRKMLSNLFRKKELYFLNKINHLIVPTPGSKNYYSKYNLKCGSTILYNTIGMDFFNDNDAVKKDKFVISYIGEIRYEKALSNLIQATKDIPDVKILIVGGGVKAENIKNMSDSFPHVEVIDHVPFKEVIKFYKKSSCIFAVYDSTNENIKVAIPVKLFEAMACGIPVIVNKNIWVSDFVASSRIGLCVNENNLEEIKNAILELKTNKKIANEYGENGRKLFEKKYNWEIQQGKLLKVYEEM